MPNWDDRRGYRREFERDRGRPDPGRDRGEWYGGERRSFGEETRYGARDREPGMEPWRRDRHGPQRDPGRYGRDDDAGAAGYRGRAEAGRYGDTDPTHGGEPWAYGGQEYGVESHRGHAGGGRPAWGSDLDSERRANFDRDDPGVGQSQAGYGQAARSAPDHDLDLDYLRWRDEQMRGHDRDYQDWRREQHRKYDEQYRQFRDERQRHFGQAFFEWRSQRSAVGGVADTGIGSGGQGQGGYGDKTGIPGGYNAASAYDKPSGYLDPPGHLSTDPAMRQVGGYTGPLTTGSGGDHTPEFGKEPPEVKAASDGGAKEHEHQAPKDAGEREPPERS